MFCSTIIPTIGRESLTKAVLSVLEQDFPAEEFEIIVVNDSGRPLPLASWQESEQVRLISTNQRKLCVARNSGAAIAKGDYLHFLDDDDWVLPGMLALFWGLAQQNSRDSCLCGAFELMVADGKVISHHRLGKSGNCAVNLISGVWVQVAAVMIPAEIFFTFGGFSPLFKVSEEIDLFNQIALKHDFVSMETVVANVLRGDEWRTTVDYSDVYEYNRKARDHALSKAGAFFRLLESADSSYWYGRIFRLYIVSMLWNWRKPRRFFIGLSRGYFGLSSLFFAKGSLLTAEFWRGVKDDNPEGC